MPRFMFPAVAILVLVAAPRAGAELSTDPVDIEIRGLSVVRGDLVFGADSSWFEPADYTATFRLQSMSLDFILVTFQ